MTSLTPLARALADLLPLCPLRAARTVPPGEALGLVLAEPVRAPGPVPSHAVALRGGWAVAAEETVGASAYAPATASRPPPWVEAGASLPPGCDAVVPPDAVAAEGPVATIAVAVAPGEGVRRRSEDAAAGAVLRDAGRIVRPLDQAAADAAGVAACLVRPVRVAVVTSRSPGPEAVIAGVVASAGGVVEHHGASRTLDEELDRMAASGADLIVCLARLGLSPDDPAPLAVRQAGRLLGLGLALRPGLAGGYGTVRDVPVLLVPDRLEAAWAIGVMLLAPCLAAMTGGSPARPDVAGPLAAKISSALGVTDLVLLRGRNGGLAPLAVGDLPWSAFAAAEAWTAVPPESEGFPAGQVIAAFPL